MRDQPVSKVVTSLIPKTHMLRAVAVSLLGLMLAAPAATTLTGHLPLDGTLAGGPDLVVGGVDDLPVGFWTAGRTYDVIVTFQDPCVVEWRVSLEARGVTDPDVLASVSREHKVQVEQRHATFLESLWKEFPGVTVNQEFTTVLNGLALTAPGEALDWMSAHPDVDTIEPDWEVNAELASSVPVINADDMWSELNASGSTITGKSRVVAVLDTGLDYSHPDLGGTGNRASDLTNVTSSTHARVLGGWNIITDSADFWDGHYVSHGTHCAGIVGANGTVKGVAPDVEFRIYKVLSDGGSGPSSGVIEGVELATDPDDDGDPSDHCDVISMSLSGAGHPDDGKSKAVDNAVDAGAVVAVAASNTGTRYETTKSPSEARKAISVGASTDTDTLAYFSAVGPSAVMQIKPDVLAPGTSVTSTAQGGYLTLQGTSMATPHVAGAAALLFQAHPDWSSQTVKRALMGTAVDAGYNAYQQGAGRINVFAANATDVVANPPSVSLGRLSTASNVTTFTVTFENLATGWTNGTLAWDVTWDLTPLYGASGDTTNLRSMLKANVTSVNITAGGSTDVKFTLTYDPTSSVGHHLGEIRLTTSTQTLHIPMAFYIRAHILLVDDDNTGWVSNPPYINQNYWSSLWYRDLGSSEKFGEALASLGLSFDVIAVRPPAYLHNGVGPGKAEMDDYRIVIWNTGFDYYPYGYSVTATDLAEMKSFVDGGGNLWLSGSRILREWYGYTNQTALPSTNDFRETFGLGGFRIYSGTPDPLGGTTGTFTAGDSYDVDVASFGNRDYGNNLTPTDGAFQILSGSDTDYWGGGPWTNITSAIARDSGSNKTVFSAFNLGHIRTAADRKDLVDEVLKWFDLRPHGAFSQSGSLKEGERLAFSGRVLDARATESYVFEWDFDHDGVTFSKDATGPDQVHIYDDDGSFTVGMRVHETRSDTYSAVVTRTLDVVNQAPEAHINTSSPGREGSPVSFWGNATDPGGNDTFTWEWDFDFDGVTFTTDSTDRNATHTYLDDGTFTVALRVTDDEGLASAINTSSVVVENIPPSGDIFTAGMANEGDNVSFTARVEDPSPLDTVTTEWDFNYDGSTFTPMANGTAVHYIFQDDGIYTVLMRLTDDDGGVHNVSLQITIRNVAPIVDFVTSAPASEGDIVDFNSTVTDPGAYDSHTYEWDFDYQEGDFQVQATWANVSWQYLQDGLYTVALRVSDDDNGVTLVTKEVRIDNVAPSPDIDPVGLVDEGSKVKFTADANDSGRYDIHTFEWDFGDGNTGAGRSPTHTYMDDGTFTVRVTVTDEADAVGVAMLVVKVRNVNPNATVEADPSHIEENGTVLFQAVGKDPSPLDQANLSYTWNFGDGEVSNEREVGHKYMDDGDYTATLTVQDDDGGTATYTVDVMVDNVAPNVFAHVDREYIVEGETVNFTALIDDPGALDVHNVSWDFDDGSTSHQTSVAHQFTDNGNFIVRLTVTDDDGGTNTTTYRIAVSNSRPVVTATADSEQIDEGGTVNFTVSWTDPGTDDTHTVSWDFGDGTNASKLNKVSHMFVQDGTYTVLVTVTDDDGGHATKPFVIDVANVAPTPIINVAVTQIDENTTVQFVASHTDPGPMDVVTYHWDFDDDGPTSDEEIVWHHFPDNGVFRVTLRALDEDGGISTPASVTITVNNVPPQDLHASVDLTVTTVGKPVTYSASAKDVSSEDTVSYSWNFGDLTTSSEQVTTHIYTTTGEFEVVLIVSDDDGGQVSWGTTIEVKADMDGDGIPDDEDDDIDGDGYKNSEDDFPEDPERYTNFNNVYLVLLLVAVVAVAVTVYVLRPKD